MTLTYSFFVAIHDEHQTANAMKRKHQVIKLKIRGELLSRVSLSGKEFYRQIEEGCFPARTCFSLGGTLRAFPRLSDVYAKLCWACQDSV